MAEEIEIIIGADTTNLNAELQKSQNLLKQFQAALNKSTNAGEINYLTGQVDKLKQSIASLSQQQVKSVASTNQAGQSLQNLSRIAQDAPFGFIGIANNINPLVESFSRLKAETGSTGGALKALVGGLSGPAGLGLAFGVVTAAISFAQMGFQAWGGASKKAKEQVDNLKKSSEDFAKSIDSARAGALSSGIALQSFVDVAKNGALPLEQRNEALKQANEILGKHGELLTLTNVATSAATREVELYTTAIVAQAVANKFADDIAKNIVERAKLQRDLTVAINENNAAQLENARVIRVAGEAARAGAIIGTLGQDAARKYADASERLKNVQYQLAVANKNIANSQIELNRTTLDATAAFGKLGTKTTESTKKKEKDKKSVETLQDAYRAFFEELVSNERIALAFNEPATKKNIESYTSFIETAIKKFKATPTFTLPLVVELNALKRSLDIVKPKDLVKSLQEKINLTPIAIPFAIPKGTIDNLKKQTVDVTSNLSAALESSIAGIGVGIGEGLAAAINGTANFGDIFQSIFNALGGVVATLGQQIIAIGAAALVAQAAIAQALANPFLVIAAGVALVALGSLIKSATSSQNRFAVGTRNAPGGMALVGERGPEMISLPRGSQVLPAAQTANMLGGVGGAVEIYGILRGQDIYFSNKKYSATYARTT